jgi:sulfur-carrier protein adenylyltransferase/sulfurtransferase
MWWVKNPVRLKSEVAELEALRDHEAWLLSFTPSLLKGLTFAVEFDIEVGGEPFPFTLEYPAFFPDTPPKVTPRDGRRLSGHQYGAGGEMCLEYRSDNWDLSVTGAMMVESTYRLLAGERPTEDDRAVVPSAHQSTLGQRLRGTSGRFFLTAGLRDYAAALTAGEHGACRIAEIFGPKRTWTAHVCNAGPADKSEWQESTIPSRVDAGETALLLRVESLRDLSISTQAALDALIETARGSEGLPVNDSATSRFTLLADHESASLYFSVLKDGAWNLYPYLTIDLTNDIGGRLPEQYAALRGKKVGLVGCGSLGSKIATSLARSGVGAFVLVDDDIMKPGNLVRHDLDAASLGAHKVDALEARLKAVSPHINVSARRVVLGGQESSGTTSSVLEELATCHLLIDATADPQPFNFVASVARSALRPMIWAEVYAGGIGGFVARLRPDIEPPPHQARRQYLGWCRQQGVPWLAEDHVYESRGAEGPVVADDADVATIAAHAVRMTTDCLIHPDASAFPHPAYVIGLSKAWLFTEPLDIRPLDFVTEGQWRITDAALTTEAVDYMLALLERPEDASRSDT